MSLGNYKNDKFDVIIIAGQSNAEGFGWGDATEEYVPDERILWLNDTSVPRFEKDENDADIFKIDYPAEMSITVADEPKSGDSKIGKFALWFARSYIEDGRLQEGRKILVLNTGAGGTGFRGIQWGVGRTLYQRLKDFAHTALALNGENRLVAFLWHQGECDSFENPSWDVEKRYTVHKANLGGMLEDFKKELSCPDLPFIAGGFCDEWYLKNKTPCDAVLKAIKEVCAEHGGFVNTSGLKSNNQQTGNGDDIHFCREASRALGRKYYTVYKQLTEDIAKTR